MLELGGEGRRARRLHGLPLLRGGPWAHRGLVPAQRHGHALPRPAAPLRLAGVEGVAARFRGAPRRASGLRGPCIHGARAGLAARCSRA
eukprot:7227111-Lingulodinium_polyedra.AAC.1